MTLSSGTRLGPHICTLHDVGPNYLVMEYIVMEDAMTGSCTSPLSRVAIAKTSLAMSPDGLRTYRTRRVSA
jgi:hypothetical protein